MVTRAAAARSRRSWGERRQGLLRAVHGVERLAAGAGRGDHRCGCDRHFPVLDPGAARFGEGVAQENLGHA